MEDADQAASREAQPPVEPDFQPARSWRAALAVLAATVAILAASTLAASGLMQIAGSWTGAGAAGAFPPGGPPGGEAAAMALQLGVFLLTMQAATVALTVAAARLSGGDQRALMGFAPPAGGGAVIAQSIATLLGLAAVYMLAVALIDRNALLADVRELSGLLKTGTWWVVALAAVVGAPLAEEMLFRGLGYGVMRASPLGLAGAAVVTAFVWAAVHAQYTVYGLAAIFLIGLYLAYVREKTGSLLVPVLCHGAYNAAIMLALKFAPESVLQAG